MLSANLETALNDQINHELYSAYLYLSMAAYFEGTDLPGFAHWVRKQSEEELGHALRFYDYIVDRGGHVSLQAVSQPPADFASPLDVFERIYAHEQKVTALIDGLYTAALEANDYASQVALQWFINEQVEEEKTASLIVARLKMIAGHTNGLLMLDHELGER